MVNRIKGLLKYKSFWIVFSELLIFLLILCLSYLISFFKIYVLLSLSLLALSSLYVFLYHFSATFSKQHKRKVIMATIITATLGFAFCYFLIYTRNYKYMADYTCYYDLQFELYNLFSDSPIKGIAAFVQSCWNSDYSYFICIFTSLPFYFGHSHNYFVIVYYLFLVIPVYYVLNILIVCFSKYIEKINILLIVGNVIILCFPVLQVDLLLGMPDIFGLVFVLGITIILFDYKIEKINWKYNILLLLLTLLAIVTRRYYIFGLIGLYSGYAISSIVLNSKQFVPIIKNLVISFAFIGCVSLIIMIPFVIHTIKADYSTSYSAWSYGGFFWELRHQIQFNGYLISGVLLLGTIYGFVNKDLRKNTMICVIATIVAIYTFVKIQNMMSHHVLLLMGMYLPLIFNVIVMLSKIKRSIIKYISLCCVVLIFVFNMGCSLLGKVTRDGNPHLVNSISIYVDNADNEKNAWE